MLSLAVAWICGLLIAKWQLPFGKSIFILIYFILISILILKLKKEPRWLNSYVHEKRYPQITLFFLCIPLLFFIGYERMEYIQHKILQEKEGWEKLGVAGETYVFVEGVIKEKYKEEDEIRIVLQQCLVKGYEGEKTGGCQITLEEEGTNVIPETLIGNKIKVYGKVFIYQKATNEGQFDAFEYYSAKGIYASIKALRLEILDENVSLIGQNMFLLKQKMRESLLSFYPKEKAGVLLAMLLGDKDLLEEEIKELYQKNGISHILAISGLHISMLCMGLFRVLRRIGVSIKLSTSITILFLSFYVCYTGGSTSSLRAGVMCIVLLGAKLLRRNYDLLSALALASILVTAIRPTELTSAGFLLSFGAVVGGVIGGFVGYGAGVALGAKASSGLVVKSISKALSSVSRNTMHHIMQSKHAWGQVLKRATWNNVKSLINTTMQKGATTLINKQGNALIYEAVRNNVVVRYAVIDGIIKISDAWVKTR